ncbi:uncharacterized protein LOC143073075 [Mytilus galloprovincialis]|uniref:uncharacterized protein LOC143073075 n=1 Tax=Mytilus galloprovincialis TaxID=29158 RepID=UPI003F7C559D
MERSSLTKRCVHVEEPNEKLNQDDMRKCFPSAKQICTIKSPSPNEDDPTIHWLLLFASEEDADDCAKQKRKQVEDNYDLMIHHCNRPCDIPHDWIGEESSGDSFDKTGATNQPEEVHNPQVPGEYNQIELGGYMPPVEYIPPEADMPPEDWPYQFYGPNEQNLSEKKGPDDVPGPSVQPYPYYPQFVHGYHGLPVHPNYPYPQDDGNQCPTKGGQHPQPHEGPQYMPIVPNNPYQHQGHMGMPQPEQGGLIPHPPSGGPPVDPDHTNVKSPIHNLVTTQVENQEKTYEYNSDESYKSASSNMDEGREFVSNTTE